MRYERLDPIDMDTDAVRDTTLAVVGAGATGSRMLEQLARLGADLIIIDRDFLEEANLATSALYTGEQVEERMPKAVAAAERLEAINAHIEVKAEVADLNRKTADPLLSSADLILDGTDNMETRFLLNEWCVKNEVPWVHVSALGSSGEAMPVIPGETACFHCVFGGVDGSSLPTCETAGILPAAASTAASLGIVSAVKILGGEVEEALTRFDVEKNRFERLETARSEGCRVCGREEFPHLDGEKGSNATRICGEDKYQVNPGKEVDLDAAAKHLEEAGSVVRNPHLLRFDGDVEFTLFRDGRMIVEAENPEHARSIYSRFAGS